MPCLAVLQCGVLSSAIVLPCGVCCVSVFLPFLAQFGEVTDRLHDQCDGNRWDFISLGSIPDCMNKDELLSLLQLLYVCCEVHGVLLLRRSCHQVVDTPRSASPVQKSQP